MKDKINKTKLAKQIFGGVLDMLLFFTKRFGEYDLLILTTY